MIEKPDFYKNTGGPTSEIDGLIFSTIHELIDAVNSNTERVEAGLALVGQPVNEAATLTTAGALPTEQPEQQGYWCKTCGKYWGEDLRERDGQTYSEDYCPETQGGCGCWTVEYREPAQVTGELCDLCKSRHTARFHIDDSVWEKIKPLDIVGGGRLCFECAEKRAQEIAGVHLAWEGVDDTKPAPEAEKPRRMVNRVGDEHDECPDCRGAGCMPVEPKANEPAPEAEKPRKYTPMTCSKCGSSCDEDGACLSCGFYPPDARFMFEPKDEQPAPEQPEQQGVTCHKCKNLGFYDAIFHCMAMTKEDIDPLTECNNCHNYEYREPAPGNEIGDCDSCKHLYKDCPSCDYEPAPDRWECQYYHGGTGSAVKGDGLCSHEECNPKNDDRPEPNTDEAQGMELKPCPFCGDNGEATKAVKVSDGSGRWFVCCDGCGADGAFRIEKSEAIVAWNRRACSCLEPPDCGPAEPKAQGMETAEFYTQAEYDKLKAEVERLNKRDGSASIDLSYATEDYPFNVEELAIVDFGVADNGYVVTSTYVTRLQAENKKMREALKKIAGLMQHRHDIYARGIAQEALKEDK
jgi:Lar family restriction alleviation protein